MESNSNNRNDNYLDNVNYVLDNLCREYKLGFDSLKEVLTFAKQGPFSIDPQQLQQFECEMICVQNNLTQLDSYYKTLCAEPSSGDVSFDLSSNSKCWSADYTNLDDNSSRINCPNELVTTTTTTANNFDYELEPVYCTDTPNNDKISPIDYLFTLNDNCDFLDFIKSDDLDNLFKIPNDNNPPKVNQEDRDKDGVYLSTISDDSQIQTLNKTPIVKNGHKASQNKSATKSTRNNHNKCNKAKNVKCTNNNCNKKSRLNEVRVWYKCGWEGCSFGSYYNGVVKRHSYKRHSGKIKIDKSSNSEMHRFKCDWPGCDVSLVAYHKLVEHKRKHTGEKPFRCKWKSCNYATARLYSMIIHERTHKLAQFAE